MKIVDIEEDLEDDEFSELNPEEILEKIPTFSAEKLSDIVIANRYLGLFKELAVAAMQELSKRRESGDDFEYEKYIDKNVKDLPKLDFEVPGMDVILSNLKNMKR